jgi:hypothetical protein
VYGECPSANSSRDYLLVPWLRTMKRPAGNMSVETVSGAKVQWLRGRAELIYQQLDGLQALRQAVRRDLLAESPLPLEMVRGGDRSGP